MSLGSSPGLAGTMHRPGSRDATAVQYDLRRLGA
jgi:hypothetical protein